MRGQQLLIVTALVETATGLMLLVSPPLVAAFLLGASLDAPAALVVAFERTSPAVASLRVGPALQRLTRVTLSKLQPAASMTRPYPSSGNQPTAVAFHAALFAAAHAPVAPFSGVVGAGLLSTWSDVHST